MAECAFTASHGLASRTGMQILTQGGTALEAMVAAAAAIAVAYPHMNSLGGDGFWLIHEPGLPPRAINAAGVSALAATTDWYSTQNMSAIPYRGGPAALTVAGTVSGWELALQLSAHQQSAMPLIDLFQPAIALARNGVAVTHSLAAASRKTASELQYQAEFARIYLPAGACLQQGQILKNPALADFLGHLAQAGLDDFYRGESAGVIAAGLQQAGSPLTQQDLASYRAGAMTPLSVTTRLGTFYNLPLPTQGIASLLILALFDRLVTPQMDEAAQLHLLVEATKVAFRIRNREAQDPRSATTDITRWLQEHELAQLAQQIHSGVAAPWPEQALPGDTVWMGARDASGRMVSFIQSIYWEFGSGVVIPELGLLWNNRGVSFTLDASAHNALQPGVQPFHTLNPALAHLADGRVLAYGTMGGEGQPQTQAAMIWRHFYQHRPLVDALAAPRWLLGRTWGDASHTLKLEDDFSPELREQLSSWGHDLQIVPPCNELMGHAGALLADAAGVLECATDPRSDGLALQANKD